MFARSMTAGFALLAFTACFSRSITPAGLAPNYATGPVRITDKILKDDAGNTVTIRLDGTDAAKAQPLLVTDANGKAIPTRDYPLDDVTLCLPVTGGAPGAAGSDSSKHPPCEHATSVTEGTFIKFGAASCTCYIWLKALKCYGSTCP